MLVSATTAATVVGAAQGGDGGARDEGGREG